MAHLSLQASHSDPGSPASILVVNAGSSSIRFAVFEAGERGRQRLTGKIERIGAAGATLVTFDQFGRPAEARRIPAPSRRTAVTYFVRWLERQNFCSSLRAVGHRVVHGLTHGEPERITPALIAELRRIVPYDPDHLPREIELIAALRRRHPRWLQVACFDTAFHRSMPQVARMLSIPRRYATAGIERYGFHGLACAHLVAELVRLRDPAAKTGRVILAHLGSGASVTAVRAGRSVDTSMGLTPAGGVMMGTRSGDVDPGLIGFLARAGRMTPRQFDRMANHESGLLGVSATSSDVRDLIEREARDPRAAEALALFCYQVKKSIGALAAVLGGVDTLVFSGGIGENAPALRQRICAGLGFLGIGLDRRRNARNTPLISSGSVAVRVIRADEERVIARAVHGLLGNFPEGRQRK